MKEALFWKPLKGKKVQCQLCPRFCIIPEGGTGYCGVRQNVKGKLFSLVYGKPCSLNIDPIEKKPLFHFAPGTVCTSISTVGCNLGCNFCFTPETIIPTDKGIITVKDLFGKGLNEIIRPNPGIIRTIRNYKTVTHNGKMQDITKVFKHPYTGNIVIIKPNYVPKISCTPSHEFFVSKNPESGKIEKLRASDIEINHYLVIPKSNHEGKSEVLDAKKILASAKIKDIKRWNRKLTKSKLEKILKMSGEGKSSKEIGKGLNFHPVYARLIMSKARKCGEASLFIKKTKIIESNNHVRLSMEKGNGIPRYININKSLGKLFGYYCAEGHVTKNKNRANSNTIIFSFAKHEKKPINETKRLLKKIFGVDARIDRRESTTTVEVCKSSLGILFDSLCGHGAKSKKVPYVIFNAKKGVVKAFLNAYIEGDGWIGNDVVSTNTVSKELALGIYRLFLNLNLLPSFYVWKPSPRKFIENRTVKQSTLYYVKLQSKMHRKFLSLNKIKYKKPKIERRIFYEDKNHFFVPIKHISKKEYSGPVYNIEVNGEHSYLANFVAVKNCQNWEISHPETVFGSPLPPEGVVKYTKDNRLPGIAYTYTEPSVFWEFAFDTMKLARKAGLYNVWVSNGYINPEPAKMAAKYMDAINIDLKGDKEFYKKVCAVPDHNPILESIKLFRKLGVLVEITNLIIPGYNDKEKQIRELALWVKENMGKETPLHFSRFYPCYKMENVPPTPEKTLDKAWEIANKAGMDYVYVGNVFGHDKESTYCPKCGEIVIKRTGYHIEFAKGLNAKNGGVLKGEKSSPGEGLKCPRCGEKIPVKGMKYRKGIV